MLLSKIFGWREGNLSSYVERSSIKIALVFRAAVKVARM
jgi:hypothetical protein